MYNWMDVLYDHAKHITQLVVVGFIVISMVCSTLSNFLPDPIADTKNPDGTKGEYLHSSYVYWLFYYTINIFAQNFEKIPHLKGARPSNTMSKLLFFFSTIVGRGLVGEKYKEYYGLVTDSEKIEPEIVQDIKDAKNIIQSVEKIDHDVKEELHSSPPACPHCHTHSSTEQKK